MSESPSVLWRDVFGSEPVLAAADGPGGSGLAGTKSRVAVADSGEWRVFGWHEIERGSWRAESGIFRFTMLGGERFEVQLETAGRLPDLFRERVQASTVATYYYDVEPEGEVRIVLRRPLGGSDALRFYAVPSGGASLEDPGTAAFIVAETDRIKAEYELD